MGAAQDHAAAIFEGAETAISAKGESPELLGDRCGVKLVDAIIEAIRAAALGRDFSNL